MIPRLQQERKLSAPWVSDRLRATECRGFGKKVRAEPRGATRHFELTLPLPGTVANGGPFLIFVPSAS